MASFSQQFFFFLRDIARLIVYAGIISASVMLGLFALAFLQWSLDPIIIGRSIGRSICLFFAMLGAVIGWRVFRSTGWALGISLCLLPVLVFLVLLYFAVAIMSGKEGGEAPLAYTIATPLIILAWLAVTLVPLYMPRRSEVTLET